MFEIRFHVKSRNATHKKPERVQEGLRDGPATVGGMLAYRIVLEPSTAIIKMTNVTVTKQKTRSDLDAVIFVK